MNSINSNITEKHIILSSKYYQGDDIDRVFFCKSGFGCLSTTRGQAVFGLRESDGEEFRAEGYDVQRFATDSEVEEAKKRFELKRKI
jgi:hypothetical protein